MAATKLNSLFRFKEVQLNPSSPVVVHTNQPINFLFIKSNGPHRGRLASHCANPKEAPVAAQDTTDPLFGLKSQTDYEVDQKDTDEKVNEQNAAPQFTLIDNSSNYDPNPITRRLKLFKHFPSLNVYKSLHKSLPDAEPIIGPLPTAVLKAVLGVFGFFFKGQGTKPKDVLFKNIPGNDNAVKELQLTVSQLRGTAFSKMPLPYGILLVGENGVGKATIAHAMAKEAGSRIFEFDAKSLATNDKELVDLQDIFLRAKLASSAVILIKNLEDIGTKRDELVREMKLNHQECNKVVVIGTTTKYLKVDPSLKKLDCFFERITIRKPDKSERKMILGEMLKQCIMEEKNEICEFVAVNIPDGLFLNLQAVSLRAMRCAALRGSLIVEMKDVKKAVQMYKEEKMLEEKSDSWLSNPESAKTEE